MEYNVEMATSYGKVIVTPEGYMYVVSENYIFPSDPSNSIYIIRWHKFDYTGCRFADDVETEKFFNELEANGYKWDNDKQTVVKIEKKTFNDPYCSFKIAKLLKEKGMDVPYGGWYVNKDNKFAWADSFEFMNNYEEYEDTPTCTHQRAIYWLWEEKGFYVNAIYGDYPALKKSFWMPQIDSLDGCYGVDDENFFKEYDNPQDCIEAALLYVLQNLI